MNILQFYDLDVHLAFITLIAFASYLIYKVVQKVTSKRRDTTISEITETPTPQ
jgi:hypothetical protein